MYNHSLANAGLEVAVTCNSHWIDSFAPLCG